jgi:broad specificity phosphatase PhoE
MIFTSPLERAATARAFSDATGAPLAVLGDLAELHHGEFAGMTAAEIATRHPGAWKRRSTDKVLMGLPRGESYTTSTAERRARWRAPPPIPPGGRCSCPTR